MVGAQHQEMNAGDKSGGEVYRLANFAGYAAADQHIIAD